MEKAIRTLELQTVQILVTAGEKYTLSNDILNNQITDNCINISDANITLTAKGIIFFQYEFFWSLCECY